MQQSSSLENKIVFTIADKKNMPYAKALKHSFNRFHKEVPFKIFGPKELKRMKADKVPEFFYKATPLIARQLLDKYELVVKIDADSVVTGDLSQVFEDSSYDLGSVLNNNRSETQLGLSDVIPQMYLNCGFVAIRSKELADHWWDLCNKPYFPKYRFREQDMMNILSCYGNYRIKCFDFSDSWYGLVSKSEWLRILLTDKNELLLPPDQKYNPDPKLIRVIHWGGGNVDKMNFEKYFTPKVANYLRELTR